MKVTTISVKVDLDIARQVRNAVYWSPGMTLTKFVENALRKAVEGDPKALQAMPRKKTLRSVSHFKHEEDD